MRRRRLRPFRLGLWLGVVAGAVWFKQRYQRSRQELEEIEQRGWSVVEPAPEPAPVAAPEVPTVPVVPVVEPEVHEVGELADVPGEPAIESPPVEPELAPDPVPEPVAEVAAPLASELDPVKKAARKKAAAPRKKAAPKVILEAPPGAPASTPVDAPLVASEMETTAAPWVAPEAGGLVCPTSHPVKAKLSSKLFHLPGMFAYARTKPDRCYRDAEAAEADGLRPAKR